jgi:hypothetical protein
MRYVHSVALAVFIALSAASTIAQDTAKFLVGRWEGQRQAEGRVDNIALVFTSTDKGLTGEVFNNGQLFDKMADIVTGDDVVRFTVGDLIFQGVIDRKAAIMKLTANSQGHDLWTVTVTKKEKN